MKQGDKKLDWRHFLPRVFIALGVGLLTYKATSFKLMMDATREARIAAAKNPCKIRVFQHNGQDVVETVSGILIKAEHGKSWDCENGKATVVYIRYIRLKRNYSNKEEGYDTVFLNSISTHSHENPSQYLEYTKNKFNESWRWTPKIPHKIYPLDLYPNFGRESREGPDPLAGKDIVRGGVFWGVRGTKHPKWGTPDIFSCTPKIPEDAPEGGRSIYTKKIDYITNSEFSEKPRWTCQGFVTDKKTGEVMATVLLTHKQIPYIDQIVKEVSDFLETIAVEE